MSVEITGVSYNGRTYSRTDRLVVLLMVAAFFGFYAWLNGTYLTTDGLCVSGFTSLMVKYDDVSALERQDIPEKDVESLAASKDYLRRLITTSAYDVFVGHPICAPLVVFGHKLLARFSPGIRYAVSSQMLMSLIGALGIALFYYLLRTAGHTVGIACAGSVLLGVSNYYRNYAEIDTGMLNLFAVLLVMAAYFSFLRSEQKLYHAAAFGIVVAFALLFYLTPLVLLPGILISYMIIQKKFSKVVQFIVTAFAVGFVCVNGLYYVVGRVADRLYGDNIYGFKFSNVFDYWGFVMHIWGRAREMGNLGANMAAVVQDVIGNFASFLVFLPSKIVFPLGLFILYAICLTCVARLIRRNDQFFVAALCVAGSIVLYMLQQGVVATKGKVLFVPFLLYMVAEAIAASERGMFSSLYRPAMTRVVTVIFLLIFAAGNLCDMIYPLRNTGFNWNPAQRKDILGTDSARWMRTNLPPGSIVQYDQGYAGPDLGSFLCIHTPCVSPTNTHFWYQAVSGNYSEFFLEYFLKDGVPPDFSMLCRYRDGEDILVPRSRALDTYLVFREKSSFRKLWSLYEFSGEIASGAQVFSFFGKEGLARKNYYAPGDVYWKTGRFGGRRACAQVPLGSDMIPNDLYRSSKNLVYW